MSEYGNIPWQYYVYGTYAVVTLFLLVYIVFSLHTRRTKLKSLAEEGFFEENKNENQ